MPREFKSVVFDVETTEIFRLPRGEDARDFKYRTVGEGNTHFMNISVAVADVRQGGRHWTEAFWINKFEWSNSDDQALFRLRQLLFSADEVVGHNIWSFDLPVVFRTSIPAWTGSVSGEWQAANHKPWVGLIDESLYFQRQNLGRRCKDTMRLYQQAAGNRIKLDKLCKCTLGDEQRKIAGGLDAVRWYYSREYNKIEEYCRSDVELTRQLWEHIKSQGWVRDRRLPRSEGLFDHQDDDDEVVRLDLTDHKLLEHVDYWREHRGAVSRAFTDGRL